MNREASYSTCTIELSPGEVRDLSTLLSIGYGHDVPSVVRYLITRELDDLRRSRVLKFMKGPEGPNA